MYAQLRHLFGKRDFLIAREYQASLLFTIDGDEARGSGRSVGNVNLFEAVESISYLTKRFGGHGAAVGVTIPTKNLKAFAQRLDAYMQKLPEDTFHEITEDEDFHIKDLTIHPFSIPHDAAQPVGYRLECEDKAVGIATDLGKYNEYIVDNLQNLDALLLEANHDIRMLQVGSYPYYLKQRILGDRGHLSNENAGKLLCRLLHDDLKPIFLGHLSTEKNYEALAYETVCSEVTLGDNPYKSRDFKIQVAKRDSISDVVML